MVEATNVNRLPGTTVPTKLTAFVVPMGTMVKLVLANAKLTEKTFKVPSFVLVIGKIKFV